MCVCVCVMTLDSFMTVVLQIIIILVGWENSLGLEVITILVSIRIMILIFCQLCTTAQLPVMKSAEKVILIQERMKIIQKKWVELKSEVNNLDRKKRKARKKEREGKENTWQ